jgi:hypothetical protein
MFGEVELGEETHPGRLGQRQPDRIRGDPHDVKASHEPSRIRLASCVRDWTRSFE